MLCTKQNEAFLSTQSIIHNGRVQIWCSEYKYASVIVDYNKWCKYADKTNKASNI